MLGKALLWQWWARQGLNLRPHPCEGFSIVKNGGFASIGAGTESDSSANKAASAVHSMSTRSGARHEGRELIEHPDAGQTFEFEDMADAIAKVEWLIGEGFLAPDWLLDSMRTSLNDPDPGTLSKGE